MMSENCTDCDNRDSHDELTAITERHAADLSAASMVSENCTDCDNRDSHDEMASSKHSGFSLKQPFGRVA